MFKKSEDGTQQDLFNSVPSMLKGSSHKQYSDDHAWHNMFRTQVVDHVDELIFKPLYDEAMGAPNASTRILIGMMALKEGFGWSDNELFEQCRFNLLVRSALGLFNLDDNIPAESTYYLFRKRVHNYQIINDIDIIELAFQRITRGQVLAYQVSGKSIRMDSKLIGSNIAWCSRFEIVHDTVALFCKAIKESTYRKLSPELRSQIKEITENESKKIVYRENREEVQKRLIALGSLIHQLLSLKREKDNPYYEILMRVYEEQYRVNGYRVELRPKEEIKSGSVQSPHDPDCAYRDKGTQKVKGYSTNVTETCDDGKLNLITDVTVAPANTQDIEFFQEAVDKTKQVLNQKPENIHADGAFQSPDNISYCQGDKISHYFTGIQGAASQFDLSISEDTLTVTDRLTGLILPVRKTKSGKWAIKTDEGKYRYFSKKEVESCKLRKQIAEMPVEKRNKRNNVEATIFQLSYFTRNNKTRYRGLFQTKMWAILRSLWINLRRIIVYVEPICQRTSRITDQIGKNLAFYAKSLACFFFDSNINAFNLFFQKQHSLSIIQSIKKPYLL
jgi:hypothetical protein